MQYSLNKDLQHLKWQPPRSWISSPDCQVATDKQQTQYQLIPKWKWKMLTNYWKFQNRSVQTFGFVYHDTNSQNHGPVWKTQSFFLNEICTVILSQDCYGKGNSKKFFWNTVGKKFQIGNVCSLTEKQGYSCLCTWTKSKWRERNKILTKCGKYLWKTLIWRANIIPRPYLCGLHSRRMQNKQRYCGQLQNHVRIANFSGGSREITIPSKSSYFFMVLRHGRSCKEMRGKILRIGEQNYSTRTHSRKSMNWRPSIQRRRNWISWRIVHSLLTNCLEVLVLGKNCQTWYSMICEQACSCGHEMDKSMWQTFGAFDLLHSSHIWIQAMLLCGKYSTTMQIRIISRIWFCKRPWRLEVDFRWTICAFSEAEHLCQEVGCARNKPQFHTFLRKLK